jgi:hypothetical protein
MPIAIGSVMTGFLHFQVSLTGSQVPGGTTEAAGERGGEKFTAMGDRTSARKPAVTHQSVRLSGGTMASAGRRFAGEAGGLVRRDLPVAIVCRATGRRGAARSHRGMAAAAVPEISSAKR